MEVPQGDLSARAAGPVPRAAGTRSCAVERAGRRARAAPGLHLYLAARLAWDPAWPEPWTTRVTLALAALAAAMPLSLALTRALAPGPGRRLLQPFYMWWGILLLLLTVLVPADIVRALVRLVAGPPDPDRATIAARAIAGTAGALATVAGAFGVHDALGPFRVREVRVPMPRLPRALPGTTIVEPSDMHVGPTLGCGFVAEVVRAANALAPDLIVITGDLADGRAARLRDTVAPLADLRARHGVFSPAWLVASGRFIGPVLDAIDGVVQRGAAARALRPADGRALAVLCFGAVAYWVAAHRSLASLLGADPLDGPLYHRARAEVKALLGARLGVRGER